MSSACSPRRWRRWLAGPTAPTGTTAAAADDGGNRRSSSGASEPRKGNRRSCCLVSCLCFQSSKMKKELLLLTMIESGSVDQMRWSWNISVPISFRDCIR